MVQNGEDRAMHLYIAAKGLKETNVGTMHAVDALRYKATT